MRSGSDGDRSNLRGQRRQPQQFPLSERHPGVRPTESENSLLYERNRVMKQLNFFNRIGGLVGTAALIVVFGICPAPSFAQTPATTTPVKIGTIGSGNIGSTLGTLWIKSGHPVLFSSRHPEQLKALTDSLGPLARSGTVSEALTFGDVVLMAVPYGVYPQIARDYGKDFAGKIVIDAGNAVIARDGEIAKPARDNGVGLTSAKLFPGA